MSIPECFLLDLEHFFYINLKAVPYSIVKRFFVLFFHWNSIHTKTRSHCKAWSYKKKKKYIRKIIPRNPKVMHRSFNNTRLKVI